MALKRVKRLMFIVMLAGAMFSNGCDPRLAGQILMAVSQGLMMANMGVMSQVQQPNRGTMVGNQNVQWPYGGFKPEVVRDSTFFTFDDNGNPMKNREFFFNDGGSVGMGTSISLDELPGVKGAMAQAGEQAVGDYKSNMTFGEGLGNLVTGAKNGLSSLFGR